ncbi:hypothetical protein CLOM_g3231 [Closterium sp. NIES-68]|nr:hypothetical protein CLOM_g3231 [Closterium sp. NIES-68]GJP59649.1 hypothetical protein CLOP_g14228 [Closterium sp. NIES-67]GJP76378.1 hypothetical protein CLOP_g6833 [Closterium sp. NIES-67]
MRCPTHSRRSGASGVILAGLLLLAVCARSCEAVTDPAQAAILSTFAASLGVGNPFFNTWAGGDPCGESSGVPWPGVACSAASSGTNVVTALTLPSVGLSGELPASLFDLTTLTNLDLSLNSDLSGSLPSIIGQLTGLQMLALQQTGIKGELPPSVFGLTDLSHLDLSLNPTLKGSLPSTIGALTRLQCLYLYGCELSGSIPTTIATMASLSRLDINDNYFSGPLPTAMRNLSQLYYFDVTNNQLHGSVPTFGTRVGHLHLSNNLFTSLPSHLGSLHNLVHLIVDNNLLNQDFPRWVTGLTKLQLLQLSNNTISGKITTLKMTSLETLSLCNCSMPLQKLPAFRELPNLAHLDLSENQFNGTISSDLFTAHSRLGTLKLQKNNLTGVIPPEIINASLLHLSTLYLSGNNLTGPVPNLLKIPSLTFINLYDNQFSGAPDKLLTNANVTDRNVSLQLYGNPLCSPYRTQVEIVCLPPTGDLEYTLPAFCESAHCDPLYPSYPAYYYPTDPSIPEDCQCVSPLIVEIQFRAAQYSEFDREIVRRLELRIWSSLKETPIYVTMKPEQVIVSKITTSPIMSNTITMTIHFFPPVSDPTWQREPAAGQPKAIMAAFDSHKALDRSDLGPYTIERVTLPATPPASANASSPAATAEPASGGVSVAVIVGVVAAGVAILALLLVGLYWLLLRHQKKKEWWQDEDYEAIEGLQIQGVQRFKLKELADATEGFSSLLGEGGYGQVYHGVLPSGETVAVKRSKPGVQVNGKEFRNEIELLSAVRHRNLVLLRGFCVEQGEQLLVYEFIERGTLEDMLRGKSGAPLSWQQRLDIACGAARGFAYLHHQIKPPIIHRDVKTANILITGSGEAKVADFGISKAVLEEGVRLDTQIKGTVGYLDPEYYLSDLLTEKSDVFSFGIVLLEIATGLRPITEQQHIRQIVIKRVMAGGGVFSVIDLTLLEAHGEVGEVGEDAEGKRQSQGNPGDLEDQRQSRGDSSPGGIPKEVEATFEWFLKLGMRCSGRHSQDRPTMIHVATELDAMRARVIQITGLRGGAAAGGSGGAADAAVSGAIPAGTTPTVNTGAGASSAVGAGAGAGAGAGSEPGFWEEMAGEGALVAGFNDAEDDDEYGQEIYDEMMREAGEAKGKTGTTERVTSKSVERGYTSGSSGGAWREGGSTTGWTTDSTPSREI